MHLFYCKICKPLGFVENQAVLSGTILVFVKHLCAKTQKIKIFPRGSDNICKKNRTFVVTEYISYNRREVRTNRDTMPLSSKNVKQLGLLMC